MLFQFDLFPPDSPYREQEDELDPRPSKRPRFSAGWQVSDHACRFCFGRILQRVSKGVVVEVRCAECGKREIGTPRMLCACGAECGDLGRALECFKNPIVTKETPHEVLVRERHRASIDPVTTSSTRPVKLKDY